MKLTISVHLVAYLQATVVLVEKIYITIRLVMLACLEGLPVTLSSCVYELEIT